LNAPCNAPPWGELVAIDLRDRKILWHRPVGTTRDMNVFGTHANLPLPTGIFTMGGNIVTGSGLVFMGATADNYIRAFNESNGDELWRARLPAGGQATPITYAGADGRQYVVIPPVVMAGWERFREIGSSRMRCRRAGSSPSSSSCRRSPKSSSRAFVLLHGESHMSGVDLNTGRLQAGKQTRHHALLIASPRESMQDLRVP
jgi:outer membrane protein assembly factor BamB